MSGDMDIDQHLRCKLYHLTEEVAELKEAYALLLKDNALLRRRGEPVQANTAEDNFKVASTAGLGQPMEEALKRAYYYTEAGEWRGPEVDEWDRWHAVAKVAEQQGEPRRRKAASKRLRAAGFMPRDRRLTCDECGREVTPQFAPLHECSSPRKPCPLPEHLASLPVCPWCDKQQWDVCQHAEEAKECGGTR